MVIKDNFTICFDKMLEYLAWYSQFYMLHGVCRSVFFFDA